MRSGFIPLVAGAVSAAAAVGVIVTTALVSNSHHHIVPATSISTSFQPSASESQSMAVCPYELRDIPVSAADPSFATDQTDPFAVPPAKSVLVCRYAGKEETASFGTLTKSANVGDPTSLLAELRRLPPITRGIFCPAGTWVRYVLRVSTAGNSTDFLIDPSLPCSTVTDGSKTREGNSALLDIIVKETG